MMLHIFLAVFKRAAVYTHCVAVIVISHSAETRAVSAALSEL